MKFHQALALVPATLCISAGFVRSFFPGARKESLLIGLIMYILFPLSMIWFPNAYSGRIIWAFWKKPEEQMKVIVLVGWILLLVPTATLLFMAMSML